MYCSGDEERRAGPLRTTEGRRAESHESYTRHGISGVANYCSVTIGSDDRAGGSSTNGIILIGIYYGNSV